jgi:hypothetical protein
MNWIVTNTVDPAVRVLADRHYSRQTPGSRRFVQSGKCLVLKVPGGRTEWAALVLNGKVVSAEQVEAAQAGWVTHWPIAEYVRHAWAGAWMNQFFHNESDILASTLIKEALIKTVQEWGDPPDLGLVTMVDPTKVKRSRKIGFTYLKAGFEHVGETKSPPKKMVFQITPDKIDALMHEHVESGVLNKERQEES